MEKIDRIIATIGDIFEEQEYPRPSFVSDGLGQWHCVDFNGKTLFVATPDKLRHAFEQWCHNSYIEYGVVPF